MTKKKTTTTENLEQTAKVKTQETKVEPQSVEKVKVNPKIRGGICEFCGIPAKECEHYASIFAKGEFRCLCNGSANPSTFNQSIYWYVEKYKVWICNTEGCRQRIAALGGYSDSEIVKFYLP
ncbi:MAG: hypothetical protein KatS3mg096_751 [Candidatus Parcubacteria bacterium]|nr:MAG: hypothetical protein KatS3mg096_751 [Candidatus Parcubacteria bacterium]